MPSASTIRGADLFCGAGGTSAGLLDACNELGRKLKLVAINHWEVAIQTHSKNLPMIGNMVPRRTAKALCKELLQ